MNYEDGQFDPACSQPIKICDVNNTFRDRILKRVTAKIVKKQGPYRSKRSNIFFAKLLIKDEKASTTATIFSESPLDAVLHRLKENSNYHFLKWTSSPVQVEYQKGTHDFELKLNTNESIIAPAPEVQINTNGKPIVERRWKLRTVAESLEAGKFICLTACRMLQLGQPRQGESKTTGRPYRLQECLLGDCDSYAIQLTLWNDWLTRPKSTPPLESLVGELLDVRAVKVVERNGAISLNSTDDTYIGRWEFQQLTDHVRVPEVKEVQWKDVSRVGGSGSSWDHTVFPKMSFAQAAQLNLGMMDDPQQRRFSVQARLLEIKPIKSNGDLFYRACEHCSRAVKVDEDGHLHCGREGCGETTTPRWRYIFSAVVRDEGNEEEEAIQELKCYDTVGQQLMHISANDLYLEVLKVGGSGSGAAADLCATYFDGVYNKLFTWKLEAGMDLFNGSHQLSYTVMGVDGEGLAPAASELTAGINSVANAPSADARAAATAPVPEPPDDSFLWQMNYQELDLGAASYT